MYDYLTSNIEDMKSIANNFGASEKRYISDGSKTSEKAKKLEETLLL